MLIVSADEPSTQALVGHLAAGGCKVTIASNGLDGFRQATRGRHDIIAIDTDLSGIDGIEVLRAVRLVDRNARIVALGTRLTGQAAADCREAAVAAILAKPVSPQEFLREVRRLTDSEAGGLPVPPAPPAARQPHSDKCPAAGPSAGPAGDLRGAEWLTTTQAARLCGLSHMTIIRHFDAGNIKGFRVPGSRFRRILREGLADFARRRGIALPTFFDPGPGAGPDEGNAGAQRPRVLVVEDNARMAAVVARVLAFDGWEVRLARTGFDAGLMAAAFRPQLVLLDIMLPGLDGREACRQIRATPSIANVRILAVSSLRNEKSVQDILASGVDDYLAKPFTLRDLRERVRALTTPGAANRAPAGQGSPPGRGAPGVRGGAAG